METCTGDLAKASTNKTYQERKRDSIWKNEKIYSHYSNELMIDTMNEWNILIYWEKHFIINKINQAVSFP
jgi:hypothetical protein